MSESFNVKAKQYLRINLKTIVGEDAVETVVEYLSTFENVELLSVLQELCGTNPQFPTLIENFIKIKGESDEATKERNMKSKSDSLQKKMKQISPALSSKAIFVPSKAQTKKNNASSVEIKEIRVCREKCGCMATHHQYFSSCMSCGRIHCDKESGGDCFFCGVPLQLPMSTNDIVESKCSDIMIDAYKLKV